ncbi:MAG: glycine oxidase ThiO [Planctomycetia bacterium]|nr:glycine oxidase ThiO [Planctomycetia bacterium]
MSDCLIVGGGVIGLSLAYELAGHGCRVRVIDCGQPGKEASWAGAGILPPACPVADDPLEKLTAISNEMHRQWSAELLASTGVDNGYRRSGAVYLARNATAAEQLDRFAGLAHAQKIDAQRLTHTELDDLEPSLRPSGTVAAAYLVPDECQIRNPRHLKALLIGCACRGVEITSGAAAEDFEIRGGRIRAVRTNLGPLSADRVCIATGSWSAALAKKLGASPEIKPVRGQMVLVSLLRPAVSRIVNEGIRYLVPRADGRLLVGSTEEDVGFDRGTTVGAVAGLLQFALSLVPDLATAQVDRTWAGLRPATRDGLPYLGRVSGLDNAFIAAGHFRSGLQLSTGTALVMSQLIRGRQPDVDLTMFRVDRDQTSADIQGSPKRVRHELPLT